jgi:hypothetical protein
MRCGEEPHEQVLREEAMPKPKPPVFHIPIGRYRQNGEVVLFENTDEDAAATVAMWQDMVLEHPATLAAGACVIIGPTTTSYMDIRTRTMIQSRTADGTWKPSATSDGPVGPEP